MSVYVAVLLVVAGIALDAAVTHTLNARLRRRKDPARLAFAITALAVAVWSLALAAMQTTTDPVRFAALGKWLLFPSALLWTVSAVWFMAYYTGVRPRRTLIALTAAGVALLAVNVVLPHGLSHAGAVQLRTITILGSEITTVVESSPHRLHVLVEAFTVLAVAYLLYAGYLSWRSKESRAGRHLALLVAAFAVVTPFNTLNDYGVVPWFFLAQAAFIAVVIIMSIALRMDALRTEQELEQYRESLEAMVEARVQELDQANELLAEEVQVRQAAEDALLRRIADLDAFQRVSLELAERADLHSALVSVMEEVRRLFESRHAYVRVFGSGPDSMMEATATAAPDRGEALRGMLADREATLGLLESLLRGRDPIVLPDVRSADVPERLKSDLAAVGVHRLLLVPLMAQTGMVGMLVLGRSEEGPRYSPARVRVALMMADMLATAVENEHLQVEKRREAAADERNRLARDLHDAVTQTMYSASLIAESLPSVYDRDQEEGERNLERLRRLVRAALSELRSLLYELRPATLEAAELPALLERLGDSLGGQLQVPIQIECAPPPSLPTDVKIALYRVCQEAFSNVAKHSRATAVRASLGADGVGLALTITDDGCGFDPSDVPRDHHGVRIMQERMEAVGGTVSVNSTPGRGTVVEALWNGEEGPGDHPPEGVD